jgi:ElaB/YqjD/DUF883 family membrane-anchored ribosome-binding protein
MTNSSTPELPPENQASMDDIASPDEKPDATEGAIGQLASKAVDELSEAVRRNPLAALGVAFTAGLFIALLTKG